MPIEKKKKQPLNNTKPLKYSIFSELIKVFIFYVSKLSVAYLCAFKIKKKSVSCCILVTKWNKESRPTWWVSCCPFSWWTSTTLKIFSVCHSTHLTVIWPRAPPVTIILIILHSRKNSTLILGVINWKLNSITIKQLQSHPHTQLHFKK